jgi:IstB-like ATP binding protein
MTSSSRGPRRTARRIPRSTRHRRSNPLALTVRSASEAAAREASGAAIRIRSARFPTRKSLEDFNFDHQPALSRDMIAHLGTSAFLAKARNVALPALSVGRLAVSVISQKEIQSALVVDSKRVLP